MGEEKERKDQEGKGKENDRTGSEGPGMRMGWTALEGRESQCMERQRM